MANKDFELKDCFVRASLTDGTKIEIPYSDMRYDSFDEIYWYQDKSLTQIEILDPNKKSQSQYKTFN